MANPTQLSLQDAIVIAKGGAAAGRYSRPADHVQASNLSIVERKSILSDLLDDVRAQAVNAISAPGNAQPNVLVVSSVVRASSDKVQELADKIAALVSSYDTAAGGDSYLVDCVLHLKP